jgi:hypothetical protein
VLAYETGFQYTTVGVKTATDIRDYPDDADETIAIYWQYNDTNDGSVEIVFDLYDMSWAPPVALPPPIKASVTIHGDCHLNGDLVPTGNVPAKYQP